MNSVQKLIVIGLAALLSACNSGSSGDEPGTDGSGSFTLKLTDAPIDKANKVVVEFIGAELRGGDASAPIVFDFEPKTIDLLDLQGVSTATLIDNQLIAAGTYAELRLKVNVEDDGELESYIELTDGSQHELIIPSGAQSGLKTAARSPGSRSSGISRFSTVTPRCSRSISTCAARSSSPGASARQR
jgi:hypothetical protein